jgi:hypothetical protein
MKGNKQNVGKSTGKLPRKSLIRNNIISISLNDSEYNVLQKYCTKYKITNRARFIRESMLKIVITQMCEDYPTLFSEEDMRRR